MKNLRLVLVWPLLLANEAAVSDMSSPPVVFDETTIRILLVASPNLSATDITQAIHHLDLAWEWNELDQGQNATTLTYTNLGIPIIAPSGVFSGTVQEQHAALWAYVDSIQVPNALNLRDRFGADIVMGLSHSATNGCGWAPQQNWLGLFGSFDEDPATGGLDLDGMNDSFVGLAVVANTPQKCHWWVLAHEFGHLLGGGHYSIPFSKALYFDSKATYHNTIFWTINVTTMHNVWGTDACPNAGSGFQCAHGTRFSDGVQGVPNPDDHDNERAFRKTSRSVANYRVGVGEDTTLAMCADGHDNDGDALVDSADPQCGQCQSEVCPPNPVVSLPGCSSTDFPEHLISRLLTTCIAGTTASGWRASWTHSCAPEVGNYEVWFQQPTSAPLAYGWTTGWPWIDLAVSGAAARLRVRSCGVSGCSAPSSASTVIYDLC